MTDTFKSYEPQDEAGYESDEYYDEPRRGSNVLWGRVALLGLGLLIAFFLGRATAGGGGSEEELDTARAELEQAGQENADLQERLAAAEAQTEETPATEPTGDATAGADSELETYTVQSGDTLRGVAQTFCGDPQLDDLIAAENGIDDATQLSVGAELVLPTECTG